MAQYAAGRFRIGNSLVSGARPHACVSSSLRWEARSSILALTLNHAAPTSTSGGVDDLNESLSEDNRSIRAVSSDTQASNSARSFAEPSPARYFAARVQSSSSVIALGLFAY